MISVRRADRQAPPDPRGFSPFTRGERAHGGDAVTTSAASPLGPTAGGER